MKDAMKPFKLQVVLDHRQRLEDQAQQKLAQAFHQEQQLREKHDVEVTLLNALCDEYEERQLQGMLSHEFILFENRIEHQKQLVTRLEWERKKAQDFVCKCREELAQASRNKQLLAKLKEKKIAEYELEDRRKEMNELDEMTVLRRIEDDL